SSGMPEPACTSVRRIHANHDDDGVETYLHQPVCSKPGPYTSGGVLANTQRSATPVLSDVGKHPVLDLVPLARARRVVAKVDLELGIVSEALKLGLPEPNPWAVRASSVCGDEELACVGVCLDAHPVPPTANALHGEGRGIVIDPDVDPPFIPHQIVD